MKERIFINFRGILDIILKIFLGEIFSFITLHHTGFNFPFSAGIYFSF